MAASNILQRYVHTTALPFDLCIVSASRQHSVGGRILQTAPFFLAENPHFFFSRAHTAAIVLLALLRVLSLLSVLRTERWLNEVLEFDMCTQDEPGPAMSCIFHIEVCSLLYNSCLYSIGSGHGRSETN